MPYRTSGHDRDPPQCPPGPATAFPASRFGDAAFIVIGREIGILPTGDRRRTSVLGATLKQQGMAALMAIRREMAWRNRHRRRRSCRADRAGRPLAAAARLRRDISASSVPAAGPLLILAALAAMPPSWSCAGSIGVGRTVVDLDPEEWHDPAAVAARPGARRVTEPDDDARRP
jgi:hypothetical protein